jgi:hypothetical protein
MSSISLSASIFMTVAVTVERYWAVCRPTVACSQDIAIAAQDYRNAGLLQAKGTRVAKYLVSPLLLI